MKMSYKKYATAGSLAVLLSIASWGVLSQSTPAAEASVTEVQTYIEQRVRENSTLDDVVASGLSLGYRPEVLAAALIILNFEPAAVAVALVNQGVSRRDAAQSVITVAGAPSSEPVLQALLIGIAPEEGAALKGQVAQIVSSIAPVVAQDAPPSVQAVPAQAEATASDSNAPATEVVPSTTSTAEAGSPASPAPENPAAASATDITPSPPVAAAPPAPIPAPPVFVSAAPPTPPVQGGGGGATRN